MSGFTQLQSLDRNNSMKVFKALFMILCKWKAPILGTIPNFV